MGFIGFASLVLLLAFVLVSLDRPTSWAHRKLEQMEARQRQREIDRMRRDGTF